jgi:hypothetical protein
MDPAYWTSRFASVPAGDEGHVPPLTVVQVKDFALLEKKAYVLRKEV